MAIQFWKDMSILVGGYELAGQGKNVNLTVDVSPLDTTALSTTGWVTVIGGLKTATVDLSLMTELSATGHELDAFTNLGVADVPHSIVSNSADGSTAYLMRGIPLSYTPFEGNVGELAMTRISGKSSTGPMARGALLHPGSASRTSSSTGTGRQLGAVSSTKTMYAALHVLSVSGTNPTLDVIVQSDDNAGFTTATSRITFTQRTTAGTYAWGSVAGPVTDDYWRVSYTIGGTATPTFAFAVTAGFI
jgi:hypothetical protein